MQHNDIIVIERTSQVKDPKTHIMGPSKNSYGPYNCRVGRSKNNLTQNKPQDGYTESVKIYVPDIAANIVIGDIIICNGKTKYTVEDIYLPNNHHIEVSVKRKGEA